MAARGDPYMSTLRQAHIIPITIILKSNSRMANVVAANTTPNPPMSNAVASFAVLICTKEYNCKESTIKMLEFFTIYIYSKTKVVLLKRSHHRPEVAFVYVGC